MMPRSSTTTIASVDARTMAATDANNVLGFVVIADPKTIQHDNIY